MIKYEAAPEIQKEAFDLIFTLGWNHIHLESVAFIRSRGSKAKQTIARCHTLGKAMQVGMGLKKNFYLVEVISEQFDKLPQDEKTKTIIHELMHIPKSFGGGFLHHNVVNDKAVDDIYDKYIKLKSLEHKDDN